MRHEGRAGKPWMDTWLPALSLAYATGWDLLLPLGSEYQVAQLHNLRIGLVRFDFLNSKTNPLDLTAVIKTPENIEFDYRLAGPFRRFPALLIDFIIRMLMIAAGYVVIMVLASFVNSLSGLTVFQDFALLIAMVVDFLLLWFYGTLFETYWNGQTPGKWACSIRVISTDGRPVNAFQALIRNLLRPADFAPFISLEAISSDLPPVYFIPTFLCSFLCMILTKRFQRLGDLAAGTMVVVNQTSWIPSNVKLEDPRIPSLASFIPPGFRLPPTLAKAIALYAERRSYIGSGRRQELAKHLATPLLKSFGFREDTSADLLLCALYYREFVAKDMFDPGNGAEHHRAPPPPSSGSPFQSTDPELQETLSSSPVPPPILSPVPPTS